MSILLAKNIDSTHVTLVFFDAYKDLFKMLLSNPSCYQRKLRLAARIKRPSFSSKPSAVIA